MREKPEDEDVELVPVPMGRETRARLVEFAKAIDEKPIDAAGMLLDDLLRDDKFWNAASAAARLH